MLMLEVSRRQRPTILVAIGPIYVLSCIYPTALQANGIVEGRANGVFEGGANGVFEGGTNGFFDGGANGFFEGGPRGNSSPMMKRLVFEKRSNLLQNRHLGGQFWNSICRSASLTLPLIFYKLCFIGKLSIISLEHQVS